MAEQERIDALILGSGEGGKYLAWHLARSGRRAVVVERRWIGGSCPNINCLPSKNEIWSAKVADLARHAGEFGMMTGPINIDMTQSPPAQAGHGGWPDRHASAELQGQRRRTDHGERAVRGAENDRGAVERRRHAAARRRSGLPRYRNARQPSLTFPASRRRDRSPISRHWISTMLPSHLIVLGGGYVGLELAQAYRRFGSRVTIVESRAPACRARGRRRRGGNPADPQRGRHRHPAIRRRRCASMANPAARRLRVRTGSAEQTIEGSDILVAAGRRPNTAGIGLDVAGVALDDRGYIKVNDKLETSAPDIWAIGECAGSPQFTHVSFDDFRDHSGQSRRPSTARTRERLVPYCMFTDPPLARVGLSETEAQRQSVPVRVAKMPTSAVLRTRTIDERTRLHEGARRCG